MSQLFNQLLLQYLGLLSQAATVVLLVVLFTMLRRHADRRTYFLAWTWAWSALALALTALVLRYNILPQFMGPLSEDAALTRVCYFAYQFGKLAFLILLLRGTLLYVSGLAHPPLGYLRLFWAVAGAVSVFSAVFSRDLVGVMFWQAFANVFVFSGCGIVLMALPSTRRSLGTRATSLFCLLTAVLWVSYLSAFAHHIFPQVGFGTGSWQFFSGRNTYFDLILEMLLAFGMVLVLFEDTRREIDTAHRELRIAHEQLLRESLLDSLTGAYNRRAFMEGAGLDDARGSFGALVVFDLDNLKEVNDRYGHKFGDALLKHFASVLRGGLRPSDKLYRLGGDEFLVVAPRAVADIVEPRMRELVLRAPPLKFPDSPVELALSASIGVADFRSVEELEAAVHVADSAMYTAKRSRKILPA